MPSKGDVLKHIGRIASELQMLAEQADQLFLAYLLSMASMEALTRREWARAQRRAARRAKASSRH